MHIMGRPEVASRKDAGTAKSEYPQTKCVTAMDRIFWAVPVYLCGLTDCVVIVEFSDA